MWRGDMQCARPSSFVQIGGTATTLPGSEASKCSVPASQLEATWNCHGVIVTAVMLAAQGQISQILPRARTILVATCRPPAPQAELLMQRCPQAETTETQDKQESF